MEREKVEERTRERIRLREGGVVVDGEMTGERVCERERGLHFVRRVK